MQQADNPSGFVQRSRPITDGSRLIEQLKVPPALQTPKTSGSFGFLGHSVSYKLSSKVGDPDRVAALNLPPIGSPEDLAKLIGFSEPRLRWLAFHQDSIRSCHYVHFQIPKKSGGTRTIAAPRPHIAACCRWIESEILSRLPIDEAAHGFVLGRSPATAAQVHVRSRVVVNMDLLDFFPTITFGRVRGLFSSLGYSPRVATVLALLVTECPREQVFDSVGSIWRATGKRQLPQGTCTSPAISNLVCRSLDRRLTGLALRLGWRYSRYADDLTFSKPIDAPEPEGVGYLMHRVRGILADEHFKIHPKKTRVMRQHRRQSVTGLVVNEKVAVPRPTIRRLRAILHQIKTEGWQAANREDDPEFVAWLHGMVGYVSAANPSQGSRLQVSLNEVLPTKPRSGEAANR